MKWALFPAGLVRHTPGVEHVLIEMQLAALITRHMTGDWGDVADDAKRENDAAVRGGRRILSAYTSEPTGSTVWVITEWDRSVTTILLPEEY